MNERPNWRADFLDAHKRHWEDAERLYQDHRLAGADHLYGLSAECGLKAVMVAQGLPTDARGSPRDDYYRVHVDELWNRFLTFVRGRPAARYATLLPRTNPFGNWSVNQRYAHRRHFTEQFVQTHRDGADKVRSLVREAQKDGVLP